MPASWPETDQAPPPPYGQYGVEGVRSILDSAGVAGQPIRPVRSVEERTVDGPGGPLRVRCYRPSSAPELPALIYIHGGGFVVGTLNGVDDLCRSLCVEAECVVVSVEYRRPPEHVFPAAADDCLSVYEWVRREAGSLGVDASRIALAGDSAGGNLALSVCTAVAEARRAMPRARPRLSRDVEHLLGLVLGSVRACAGARQGRRPVVCQWPLKVPRVRPVAIPHRRPVAAGRSPVNESAWF
ncbi:alpha/beta hydrolase fold domain-containing protein [Nocardia nova]